MEGNRYFISITPASDPYYGSRGGQVFESAVVLGLSGKAGPQCRYNPGERPRPDGYGPP